MNKQHILWNQCVKLNLSKGFWVVHQNQNLQMTRLSDTQVKIRSQWTMSQWGSLPAHNISSVVTACCEMAQVFQRRPGGFTVVRRSREDAGSSHPTVSFVASRRRQSDKRIEWLWASMTRRSGGSILVCQSKWTRVIYIYCIHWGPLKTRRPAPPSVHQEELQRRGQVCRQHSEYGVRNVPLEYIYTLNSIIIIRSRLNI